jgi:hypothetical protein
MMTKALLLSATLMLGLAAARPAVAAPQALGLVASNGAPTALDCSGSECSALFSAFCLQEARPAPSQGDAYAPTPGSAVTLLVTRADGSTARVPGAAYLRFSTLVGFTSMRIALPRASLAELGAVSVAVEVGPRATMLPVPVEGDRNPQSEAEIALATGPLRAAGEAAFDKPGPAADAARLTSAMINALPQNDFASGASDDGIWRQAVTPAETAAATREGVALARRTLDDCRLAVEAKSAFSLRGCLVLRHADLMSSANQKFWESLAGS